MRPAGPRHLFVYGTLMRGSRSPYAKLLQARAQFLGKACAPGRLYHLGRFPGAVFDSRCPAKVHGEVFRLNAASILGALDAYEGCRPEDTEPQLFRREIIEVVLCRGGTLSVWAYPLTSEAPGRPLIASGRYQLRQIAWDGIDFCKFRITYSPIFHWLCRKRFKPE